MLEKTSIKIVNPLQFYFNFLIIMNYEVTKDIVIVSS